MKQMQKAEGRRQKAEEHPHTRQRLGVRQSTMGRDGAPRRPRPERPERTAGKHAPWPLRSARCYAGGDVAAQRPYLAPHHSAVPSLTLALALIAAFFLPSARAAVRGDGSSARLFVYPPSTNLNILNDITIAAWIIKDGSITSAAEWVNKGRSDSTATNFSFRDDSGGGGLEFYYANPAGTFHGFKSVTKCPQQGTPIHIAVTHRFGTTNNSMFWINGVRANVQASFGTPQSTAALTNSGSLAVLGYTGGAHARIQLHELAIWDVRLSPEEIATLAKARSYNLGYFRGPRPQSLRGYWTFHEVPAWQTVTGAAYRDYSGWNAHFTATNSPASRPILLAVP